jgi:hypothetical protein
MGAHSVNSGVPVLVAAEASPLTVVVSVLVTANGKVAWTTPAMFVPEQTPVEMTTVLSVRAFA